MRQALLRIAALTLVGLGSGITTPLWADTLELTATIRDFRASHPDFEQGVFTVDQGFVSEAIGIDRKPVYVGGASTPTTNGQTLFDQWYRNVPGVNTSVDIPLVLDNGLPEPGGVYTFSSGAFFPIDGLLFGNEGRAHNYHFTLELHSQFRYEPRSGLHFSRR